RFSRDWSSDVCSSDLEALAALERGIVSASVLSAPTTLLARRMGFKEVVNIATLNLPYVHNGLVTRRSLTRQQPERIKAFLRAYRSEERRVGKEGKSQ